MSTHSIADAPARRDVITNWNPEDEKTWDHRQAWITLWTTTFALLLGFMVWYMVSVIAPMLQASAVVDKTHAFWLTAMPGLAGGLLRLVWMFFPPILGTKKMVAWSSLALLLPMAGWAWLLWTLSIPAPQGVTNEKFGLMMMLAFLTGIGGGIFSGYMPSTSYFFPKAKQGVALGLQAGIGNFGVAVVQLLTPILVGVALLGPGKQVIRAAGKKATTTYLSSPAAFVFILLVIAAVLAFFLLKSVPIKANFKQQFDIFGNKHTWLMTLIYLLTFGCFSGLAGVFALMMTNMMPKVPVISWLAGGVAIAFLGAFIGSLSRVIWGPLCDKFGGGIWTLVSALGIAVSAIIVIVALSRSQLLTLENGGLITNAAGKVVPAVGSAFCHVPQGIFLTGMFMLFFFAGVGNAATFKQMPMIFPPRQAGGVIGWTAAIAAFGPFLFSVSINALTGAGTGTATGNFGTKIIPVFVVVLILAVICAVIDWWFYTRPNAEAKC